MYTFDIFNRVDPVNSVHFQCTLSTTSTRWILYGYQPVNSVHLQCTFLTTPIRWILHGYHPVNSVHLQCTLLTTPFEWILHGYHFVNSIHLWCILLTAHDSFMTVPFFQWDASRISTCPFLVLRSFPSILDVIFVVLCFDFRLFYSAFLRSDGSTFFLVTVSCLSSSYSLVLDSSFLRGFVSCSAWLAFSELHSPFLWSLSSKI